LVAVVSSVVGILGRVKDAKASEVDVEFLRSHNSGVSLAEVKIAIDKLSDFERSYLQAYLHHKNASLADRRAELSRRMREMDEGKGFTLEQIEELHRKREADGL